MEQKYLTINKQDNTLLYVLDSAIDKFVVFMLAIAAYFVPERYKNRFETMTQHKEMLHNVIGLTFFNALGGVCVMATQVKLANYLGASIYGVYSYCLAIGEVGAMFVRYGRNKTMVRDLIQMPEKRESLTVSTFWLAIINLALFLTITFLFHSKIDIKVEWAYFLLIVSPCLISLDPGPVYESLNLISWQSIYTLLQKFGFLIVIWFLFLCKIKIGLLSIGIIVTASWVIVLFMQFREISQQLGIYFFKKISIQNLIELYKNNFLIFLSCLCGVAFGPIIRMMLNEYSDSVSVGIFAAGLQIYQICLFFNTQVGRVGNPMMAKACRPEVSVPEKRRKVLLYTLIMLLTAIPFVIPLMFFPSQLTSLLYTQEYESLASYLPYFGIYLLAISIGVVYTQFLISMRKDFVYFMIYILSAVATIIVAYLLIPKYSVLGAVIALCVPHSVGCLFYMLFSFKYL